MILLLLHVNMHTCTSRGCEIVSHKCQNVIKEKESTNDTINCFIVFKRKLPFALYFDELIWIKLAECIICTYCSNNAFLFVYSSDFNL